MIDRLFQTVQAGLDKEQKDYLRPLYFNLYLNASVFTIYNKLLSDVKSNVRKSNWMLDGKNLADYSEHTKQLLEHYLTPTTITSNNGYFTLGSEIALIQDVSKDNIILEKVDVDDFTLLKRNKVSPPKSILTSARSSESNESMYLNAPLLPGALPGFPV